MRLQKILNTSKNERSEEDKEFQKNIVREATWGGFIENN